MVVDNKFFIRYMHYFWKLLPYTLKYCFSQIHRNILKQYKLNIPLEFERYSNIPRKIRVYNFCIFSEVGDEFRFYMVCPKNEVL